MGGIMRGLARQLRRKMTDAERLLWKHLRLRPTLPQVLAGTFSRARRDTLIVRVVERQGYSQREVADFVGLHSSTASRLANRPKARSKT
jgi:very-short-patch-repair endonuclease